MKWKKRNTNTDLEKKYIEKGFPKFIARLLSQRNIDVEVADDFLSSDYSKLTHPHKLHGVKEAADVFCSVALDKGNVAVFGDYDLDGITSSVMINELCNVFDLKCDVFLPSRLEHGYGLNAKSLNAFKKFILEKGIPDLLFVVDCGMNSPKEIDEMRKIGIKKIIIIDHHLSQEEIPKADSIISWLLSEEKSEMCTTGEIFQFIRGIRWVTKKVNPIEFLTYAAMGTIADCSPVVGDNRIIVKNGLQSSVINSISSVGLISLMSNSGLNLDSVSQEDISFKIAPKINAAGRIHDPRLAYHTLIATEASTAELLSSSLNDYNTKRKKIQKDMELQAIKMVNKNPELYEHGILVSHPDWHIGVVGIVASRLAEIFNKPAIVIGRNGDVWKGSGRSVPGVHLQKLVKDGQNGLFSSFGGHAEAIGVTLAEPPTQEASSRFSDMCDNAEATSEARQYDAELGMASINMSNSELIFNNLYPYCRKHNPEPIFKISNATIHNVQIKEGENWKLMKFGVKKNGKEAPLRMRLFNSEYGEEITGLTANVYISFPQSCHFYEPLAHVVDLEFKN